MIQVSCPRCRAVLKVSKDDARTQVQCPGCGQRMRLPEAAVPEQRARVKRPGAMSPAPPVTARKKRPSVVLRWLLLVGFVGLAAGNVIMWCEVTGLQDAKKINEDSASIVADLQKRLAEAQASGKSVAELWQKDFEDAKRKLAALESEHVKDADRIQSLKRATQAEASKGPILESMLDNVRRKLADLEDQRKQDVNKIQSLTRALADEANKVLAAEEAFANARRKPSEPESERDKKAATGQSPKPFAGEDQVKELFRDPEIKQMFALVNQARSECGLRQVTLDADLSVRCGKHAQYLALNRGNPLVLGLKAHEEHKELKGYTEEGARAGPKSVIAEVSGTHVVVTSAIEAWLATFYHRIPLINPNLTRIGIGYARGPGFAVACIDTASQAGAKEIREPVYYPVAGQKNVPLKFSGNESPNPIPTDYQGPVGFPITITFPKSKVVTQVKVQLLDPDTKEMPYLLSTPESPATTALSQGNTVCFFPKAILAPASTYAVQLQCMVSGVPFERTWRFTTREN